MDAHLPTLGALLFEGIVAELVEKNLAQRLWDRFEERLQVVMTALAKSGSVDLKQFRILFVFSVQQTSFPEASSSS